MSFSSERWRRRDRVNEKLFDAYLQQIGTYPLINAEEEARLARRIRQGKTDALEALVCAHLRFVVKVAKHYQNLGLEFPDLVDAGNIGLVIAARRFDENRGFHFISYAVHWIRQKIREALYSEAHVVRVPAHQIVNKHRMSKAKASLATTLRREPSEQELADDLGLRVEEVMATMQIANEHFSLDMPLGESGETLLEILPNLTAVDPIVAMEKKELKTTLVELLQTLPEREQFIFTAYYGLDGSTPLTLEQIGNCCTPILSRERVRQIVDLNLRRLKIRGKARGLDQYLTTPNENKKPFY